MGTTKNLQAIFVNYIELFAGCGGLSLGLKSCDFELLLANELSPQAAETFAFNFFQEDLEATAALPNPVLHRTLWLNSEYGVTDLVCRLREDPRRRPELGTGYSDVADDGSNLEGSLIVGSIVDLNTWLVQRPAVAELLRAGFGDDGVDLVSGGPPCQSFSMAGLRKQDCEKNSLPWEFVKFTEAVQPRLVLLENVTGILRPFTDEAGVKYYAWYELAKAFSGVGYIPLCLHVNAKYAGVPQNRPRFILIGIRRDFYDAISASFNQPERDLLSGSFNFFEQIQAGNDPEYGALHCFDLKLPEDFAMFRTSFLQPLVAAEEFVSVERAIDDLRANSNTEPTFARRLDQAFGRVLPARGMRNHDLRRNGPMVSRRFRIYQVLSLVSNSTRNSVVSVLKGEAHEISDDDWEVLSRFEYITETMGRTRFDDKYEFIDFLKRHPTKKLTQKALIAGLPAPAALSIPDDACHYHENEQRTLTVREMARIQSFPDNFEFRSKITTGGDMRRFEVPQYTQVGNAVPPLLGRALGEVIAELLARVELNR
jgi:DNA (cytosine-5)-methyltransferase 1